MKLYVGNLPWTVDEAGLKKLFESYKTEEVTLIKDKYSGRSKGFGFVTIADDAEAKKAVTEMNGKQIEGRELKVTEAKPMEDRPPRRDFNSDRRSRY
ncbi:RNA-binding protein [Candidatus Woesearchaeota archaeon]|nr:RNA-binding protein [Candidatus Woesearchaeota archaeon]